MMIHKKSYAAFFLTVGLLLFAITLSAQVIALPPSTWEKSLILRKGVETKDDKDKPAAFSFTWPQDGKDASYLVNAALAGDFTHLKTNGDRYRRVEIMPSIGYNRNNQIKKEQNNFKGVIAVDYLLGKQDVALRRKNFLLVYPTAQYMYNKIDSSHSFFATAYVGWNLKIDSSFGLTDYMNIGNSGLLYYLAPSTGLEYQNRFSTKAPGTQGFITRWYFSIDARLRFKDGKGFPHRYLGLPLFELTAKYTGRQELGSNIPMPEKYTHLFKTEFSYFPLKTDAVAVALSYTNGEDPIAALELQNFWQLAFKLKLDYPKK